MVLPVIYLPTVALLDRHCYEFGRVMIQFYHKRSPKYEERKKKKRVGTMDFLKNSKDTDLFIFRFLFMVLQLFKCRLLH